MFDRETLKQEIKEEILKELKERSRKNVPAIETIRKKWFNGPDPNYRYSGSEMEKLFGSYGQHRVWDALRTLTRLIFGKDNQAQLQNVDPKELEHVMNALCEYVYNLKKEQLESKKE